MKKDFRIAAWLPPLPGAVATWLNLAGRGECAVLDCRYAAPQVEPLLQHLAAAGTPKGGLGLAVNSATDPLLVAVRRWALEHGVAVFAVVPAGETVQAVEGVRWMAQVTSADELPGPPFEGYVLTGHEAGGEGAEATSFMLLQKIRPHAAMPLWVRGGVGPAAASACAAGGADGVFFDDALLLFPELGAEPGLVSALSRLNGSETRLIGESLDQPWRVYAPLKSAAAARVDDATLAVDRGDLSAEQLPEHLRAQLGWADGDIWPVGQGVGMAPTLASTHGRISRLLASTRARVKRDLVNAARQQMLAPGSALAQSMGTRYPLVQGPMTRVSDSPAFAAAVAEGGGLPFLALALLRGPQVEAMLEETTRLLGDKPWGVGLLGFIPEVLRKEQLAVVRKFNPQFALIAGGRPDQAAEFEEQGVAAWLHVPSPALLRMYLEQGARRFIFEGRECGGHIGPLSSFALWEQMVSILATETDAKVAAEVEILFAGGISDALSGAMISALAAPLVERGVKVGALMGTAYLFTREIVESGAILPEFREQAVACRRTRNLVTGPGHATRCADTPFAAEFLRERQRLSREGLSPEALRDALEDLNLGRLRLASKGQDRNAEGELVTRDAEAQRIEGMYMIGQVATLRDAPTTVAELHDEVTAGAVALLADQAPTERAADSREQPVADVAVVGINVILPQAQSPDNLWRKLVNLETTITEVPRERWDTALYFDPDKNARDKIYSRWGGFLDDVIFDPVAYGIAPNSMRSIDPMQLLSLESTARALKDAGFGEDFDREHTSIILGAGGGVGELGLQYGVRAEIPRFVEDPDDGVWDRLPEWTNESFAGVLLNVAAGRIANRLNFGGVNFVVDAACGSSLAAITLAVNELTSGRSNVAIAGGVDNVQGPYGFLCFAKTQALSPTGQPRTFDTNADGIVISEGVATVVMKRLADAERDGDRVYAVIKGAAGSSDGKALGMTAPLPAGQKRALRRVYRQAGYGPETLGYVEAHGTGTAVGDRAEAETIVSSLREHGAEPGRTAVGSAKTLVGHTKCAAGVVGLIKSTLALHHQVLPGHFGVEIPIKPFQGADAPAYLLRESRPWLARTDVPRRAAVSAFGFGGTNFHATLEEYPDPCAVPGARDWPQELVVLSAADGPGLARKAAELAAALTAGTPARLADIAASLAAMVAPADRAVASFVADSVASLQSQLQGLCDHLQDGSGLPATVELNLERPGEAPAVAFLFPGQGAQAINRGCEAALYLRPLRAAMERADALLSERLGGRLSDVLWPVGAFDEATRSAQQQRLTDTRMAQPALGTLALGFHDWLTALGIQPAACAGHSYGEFVALHAAGAMDADSLLRLSAERGLAMAAAATTAPGAMAAVLAPRDVVEALIADSPDVYLANHNSPEQVVVTGTADGVAAVLAKAETQKLRAQPLPVAGAFHSPLMKPAQKPLSDAIAQVKWRQPRVPVYANRDGRPYPTDPQKLAAQLDAHLLGPVEFVAQLQQMQADGVSLFIEVGSKNLLAGMLRRTLGDNAECVSIDGGAGGLASALKLLATLIARGIRPQLSSLWAGRARATTGWSAFLASLAEIAPPRTAWLLSGGAARPLQDPQYKTGKRPALTAADKAAAVSRKEAVMTSTPAPGAVPQPPVASAASPVTSPPAAAVAAAAVPVLNAQAFAAYQETMRAFLALQEKALSMALGVPLTGGAPATQPAPVSLPAVAAPAAVAPVAAPVAVAAAPATPAPAPVSVAPPPVAPVVAASVPADSVPDTAQLVLGITADKTGYPADMLDIDADLEADLGIDSIKRVEIVGAIQKALPEAIASQMQAELERYTRAKSLNLLVAAIDALRAPMSAPVSTTAAPAASAAETPAVNVAELVVSTTADKTGYPADMLERDADLEADLGIDSIKRVEIVGAIQKALPEAIASQMQAELERYTRAKTLNVLIAAIETVAVATESPGKSTPDAKVETSTAVTGTPAPVAVPRQVIRMQESTQNAARKMLAGSVCVIGADEPLQQAIRDARLGRKLVFLPANGDYTALATEKWAAVLYLPALFCEGEGAARALLSDWLLLAQVIGADGVTEQLLVATRLGGDFARSENGVGHPVTGGLVGGMLCLAQELPAVTCRIVDFNGHSSERMAELLKSELNLGTAPVEVGYRGTQRLEVTTVVEPFSAGPERTPAAGQVVLAIGGARGITLACLQEFVQRQPQTTLVLVGRSAPADAAAPQQDAGAWRRQYIAEAQASGEKVTPREIDARVSRQLAAQEVRAGISTLEACGARVEYHSLDARDGAAVSALMADLRSRYARIDGLIHAAGVIEDKLIADKTPESFARVIGTKLDTLGLLVPLLADAPPRWTALFTSVAGRYGNRGQSDYACANEAMNRWAWVLSRTWSAVRAFNWGPWDAGMASAAVRAQFRERGIVPIPVQIGAGAFVDEMVAAMNVPTQGDLSAPVELVFGAGPWTEASGTRPNPESTRTLPAAGDLPGALVSGELEVGPGGALQYRREISLQQARFLNDHRLDGTPVMPAAAASEWMAEVAAAGWPDWQLRELVDVQVLSGISFPQDAARELTVVARSSSHSGAGEQWVSLDIRSGNSPRALYRARARLSLSAEDVPPAAPAALQGVGLKMAEAYARRLFHGPLFQLVDEVTAISPEGVDAKLHPSDVNAWVKDAAGGWMFDPGVVDCIPQLAIVWSREMQDTTVLPSRFGRVARFGEGALPQRLSVRLRVRAAEDNQVQYDAWVLDADTGAVRLLMQDCAGTASAELNRLAGQAS